MGRRNPNRFCVFSGCEKPVCARGLCMGHWKMRSIGKKLAPLHPYRRKNTQPRIICDEVYCPNHDLLGPCHVFRGSKNNFGYGKVAVMRDGKKRFVYVHRLCWEREVGKIPQGLVIDHKCRNPGCCNVDHLRLVTMKINSTENVIRKPRKKAAKHGLEKLETAPVVG